jgi:cobalt/nickel transport system ATP-binding protein
MFHRRDYIVTERSEIVVQNYSYTYSRGIRALKEVSFELHRGEHTVLFGLNGSGKSTLLRSIVGILRGEGEIHVQGVPVEKKNLKFIRKQVGYVFQDPQVQLFCPTVIEDVAFGPLNYHGDEKKALNKARNALHTVGYHGEEYTSIHSLSMGEMRKVALAGVLAMEPEILLLDEPDAFLDTQGKRKLINILNSLKDVTLVLITHDYSFAEALCNQSIFLKKGAIAEMGSVTAMKKLFS